MMMIKFEMKMSITHKLHTTHIAVHTTHTHTHQMLKKLLHRLTGKKGNRIILYYVLFHVVKFVDEGAMIFEIRYCAFLESSFKMHEIHGRIKTKI